ncbi:MAG: transposase [Oligoflexales bacterium]|nr:transposase [Oligoflexales bacterium]
MSQSQKAGNTLAKACQIIGVSVRTFERWRKNSFGDQRRGPLTVPANKLNEIERDFSNSNSEIRLKARQGKSLLILEEIKKILYDNHADVPPKSLTGKAIHYTLSEWNKLTVYTSEGNLKIDNNFIENKIRPFCIGRKNWLFADTPAGADASAAIYSIIITAKANGIDTYSYLRFLFERMPAAKTAEEYEQLLPWNFKKSFH